MIYALRFTPQLLVTVSFNNLSLKDPWMEDHDKLEARLHPPSTDVDKCRLFTFKTLWKKGYYIGEGMFINFHYFSFH